MKQKLLYLLLVLIGCGFSLRAQSNSDFAGGDGGYETPFLIETAEQLAALNNYLGDKDKDKYFRIVKDIDLSAMRGGEGWLPIGEKGEKIFFGNVDGGNHTIRGLSIDRSDRDYVGLFGYVKYGRLSNLTIEVREGDKIVGKDYVGVLTGFIEPLSTGTTENCRVINKGTVIGNNFVGGLVGYSNGGNFKYCSADVHVKGNSRIGGLIGYMNSGSVIESYATGTVLVSGQGEAGGLIGYFNSFTGGAVAEWNISNCYATGDVTGESAAESLGGLLGIFSDGKHIGVKNSYATGTITTSAESAGGLIGSINTKQNDAKAILSECFFLAGMINGKADKGVGPITGDISVENTGVSKSDAELKNADTYNHESWYFRYLWHFPSSDSYPILQQTIPLPLHKSTANNPWEIASYPELVYLREHYLGEDHSDKYFLLTADIDMGEWLGYRSWGQIGNEQTKPFCGQFDGGGNKISGLLGRPSPGYYGGLFGYTLNAVIKNLTLEITDEGITGSNAAAGALVGWANGTQGGKGLISNCGVTGKGKVSVTNGDAGGLVGILNVPMENCYAEVAVEATGGYAGGLVGDVDEFGKITYSYAGGNVTLRDGMAAGGLAGDQSGPVSNSFAYGGVTANGDREMAIGGLIGVQRAGVENCYAIGRIKGTNADMGGLIGSQWQYIPDGTLITASFFDTQETGLKEPFGYTEQVFDEDEGCGITPLSTIEMIKDATYIDAGWPMGGSGAKWTIDADSPYPYPHFDWRTPEGWQRQYQEPVNTYHTISLEVAPGIYCNYLPGGDLMIAENEHLHLTFHCENSIGEASDILFMIDGEEVAFKETGNGGSYILNPITQGHTIVIALREYSVVMPEVDGAQTDPAAGTYPVSYGEPFRFAISLNDLNGFKDLKVLANGIELTADPETKTLDLNNPETGQAQSLQYVIDRVVGPVEITIEGVNPTGNAHITSGTVSIAVDNGELIIDNLGEKTEMAVYTLTGHIYMKRSLPTGTMNVMLPQGVYIIRAGSVTAKVVSP